MSAISPGQLLVRPIMNGRPEEVALPELQTQRKQDCTEHYASRTVCLCCTLVCILFLAPSASASFIGAYSLGNFTLINSDGVGGLSNTNGFAMSPDGGMSVVLTGGNSGSGFAGTTDLLINAVASGLVQFRYSYSSLDVPGFDWAGYLLNSTFSQLSDTDGTCSSAPCPGMIQFSVSVGQSFGFRVGTMDNQGEPGVLTIFDFGAPGNTTTLPELGNGPVMVVLFAAYAAARLWRSKRSNRGNK